MFLNRSTLLLILSLAMMTYSLEIEFLSSPSGRFLSRDFNQTEIEIFAYPNRDYFTTNISIGNPSQKFNVQVDTTSSLVWVPAFNWTDPNPNNTIGYKMNMSSTAVDSNMTLEVEDEDGDVKGIGTFDDVEILGFKLKGFGFVRVTKYDDDFNDHKWGKLGLGYRHEHGPRYNFLEQLKLNGLIQKKIFSLREKSNGTGLLQIGDLPSDYDDNSYTYCNLTTTEGLEDAYRAGWVCEITHIIANSTWESGIEISGRAIFDSAYNYISAPFGFVDTFKNHFLKFHFNNTCADVDDDDETITFVCPKRDLTNVSLGFVFNGISYVIKGEDLFENLGGGKMQFLVKFFGDDNVWSLGHPFLSKYVVIYNAEDNQVGFLKGERVDYTTEWNRWFTGYDIQEENRMFLLVIGACVLGTILLIVVIFLIVHSIKRRRLGQHGPLINERA